MTPGGTSAARRPARDVAQAVRDRVRLRTRLRRAREAWRHRFPRPLPPWSDPPVRELAMARPVATAPDGAVLVDASTASPRGRQRYGSRLPTGRLAVRADRAGGVRWEVVRGNDRVTLVAGRVGDALDEPQRAVLAQLGAISFDAGADPELLVPLAMTGVVLHWNGQGGAAWRAGLSPELADLLTAPLPGRGADPMAWEVRSVRQRRAALRHHAAGLAGAGRPPPVSALLVSKRPQLLAGAVAALAAQTYPELEIVVGLHGTPAPADFPAGDRPVRLVPIPSERCLGEALAQASAAASGTVVTKVDDDDRYGPEHIWDLVLARHHSAATVVGKGAEFVYLAPKDLTVRRRMAAEAPTDTVAGGTIALARDDLAAAGGWPPVPRSVDRALLDRVIAAGGGIYRTHPLGFVYTRHGDGHTWDPGLGYFLRDPVRKWRGLPPDAELGAP